MTAERPVEPLAVAQEVEQFIYQRGFNDGRAVESWKRTEQRNRQRARQEASE